jgi:hypothetical protein
MGKMHAQSNWLIRVQGNEHPLVHVHVIHPDSRSIVYLDGALINSGVPADVMKAALRGLPITPRPSAPNGRACITRPRGET